ncbi:unnamed protein product, partial [Didymodactylos carnosus]
MGASPQIRRKSDTTPEARKIK